MGMARSILGDNRMKKFTMVALCATSMFAVAQPAQAAIITGTFAVTALEGRTMGDGFNATETNPFNGSTASATFTYTGGINFDNRAGQSTGATGDLNSTFGFTAGNVTNYLGTGTVSYMGSQVADFRTEASFLASSGSSANYQYGSLFTFNLGTLLAGTVLTITHDDGAAFYQGNTKIGNTVVGPTGVSTSTFTVQNTGNTVLRYTRQNGTPSVLIVDATSPVPEPATWAMMTLGFGAMGFAMRRKSAATRIRFA